MWEIIIIIKSEYAQTLQFLTIDFTRSICVFFTYMSLLIVLLMIICKKSESPIYL